MTDSSYTHLALLVDRSGSMRRIAADMNGGIAQLMLDQEKVPGKILVDITTFDDQIEFPYQHVEPSKVTGDVLVPRGSTALNDALGRTILTLGAWFAAMDEDDRPGKVIFVVVTDGMENASHEFTTETVKGMVTEHQEQWGWEFLFMAANIDVFATGAHYGFAQGQSLSYAASAAGAQGTWAAASAGVTRSRVGGTVDFTDAERDAADPA